MAKTITLQELKPGDIVLFSPPPGKDFWESLPICLLTGSPVSHSGMIYSNPGFAIQEIPDGAECLRLPEPGTRTLYIRRLEGEPDTSVINQIGMKYVDQKLPYPMSNLVFLGMYILVSDFMPNTVTGKAIESVLKIATYAIMEFVNKHLHPGTSVPPMVCSQFVAACYDEAANAYGTQYRIHYNDDVSTLSCFIHKLIDQLEEEEAEKAYEIEQLEDDFLSGMALAADAGKTSCENLAKAIQEQQSSNLLMASGKVSDSLIAAFYQYGRGILKLFGSKTEYPDKKQATAAEIESLLKELLQIRDAFITPGDLLSRTTNLLDMGELVYTQEEINNYWGVNAQ